VKPTLVTGATGFIGWHVARKLLARGHTVRALVRPGSKVRELEVEEVTGDLRDRESLERAVAGCGVVLSRRSRLSVVGQRPSELYRSNFEGTRNLLTAARDGGVERVVYTSTVGCIGIPEDRPGSEDLEVHLEEMTAITSDRSFRRNR